MQADLVDRILDTLPQTQCQRCGFPDCAAYATAIASGTCGINQCPPGGQAGVRTLAQLTGVAECALDAQRGASIAGRTVYIDEDWCIGCTRCIPVCPTDAILGAPKRMHTVMESYCTGCDLCRAACPVDCIHPVAFGSDPRPQAIVWDAARAQVARARYAEHKNRLHRSSPMARDPGTAEDEAGKRAVIAAILTQAQQNRPSARAGQA